MDLSFLLAVMGATAVALDLCRNRELTQIAASLKRTCNINRAVKVVTLHSTEGGHRLALYSAVRCSL